ncbi:MAG: helix-turn-helix domain-containing protein [Draconibacterium sp.]
MNFNEFVNQFRLANFKEIAVDENNAHLSILGLAYESGFNSKTVFNAYFKKMENTTPGNWLKQAKQ